MKCEMSIVLYIVESSTFNIDRACQNYVSDGKRFLPLNENQRIRLAFFFNLFSLKSLYIYYK